MSESSEREKTTSYVKAEESLDPDTLITYVQAELALEDDSLDADVLMEEGKGATNTEKSDVNFAEKYGRPGSNITAQYNRSRSNVSNVYGGARSSASTTKAKSKNPRIDGKSTPKAAAQTMPKPKKKSKRKAKAKAKLEQVVSDDTWATQGTMKSVISTWTVGTGFMTNVEYLDEDFDNLLYGNDVAYVKKRFGVATMAVTLLQLFVLIMVLAVCGFAAFFGNEGIGPNPDALSNAGATNAYLIEVEGQYWRFLTSPLIPASVLHYILNSIIQLEVGAYLERKWGIVRWIFIYLFSGATSVTFTCILDYGEVHVAGTGAVMGLIGAQFSDFLKVMCFRTTKHQRYEDSFHQQILMLLIVLVVSLLSLIPYVSWAGHLGGFIGGFCAGMIVLSSNIKNSTDRNMYVGYGMLLAVLLFIIAISAIYEKSAPEYLADVCQFYNDIHVENYDCMCGF